MRVGGPLDVDRASLRNRNEERIGWSCPSVDRPHESESAHRAPQRPTDGPRPDRSTTDFVERRMAREQPGTTTAQHDDAHQTTSISPNSSDHRQFVPTDRGPLISATAGRCEVSSTPRSRRCLLAPNLWAPTMKRHDDAIGDRRPHARRVRSDRTDLVFTTTGSAFVARVRRLQLHRAPTCIDRLSCRLIGIRLT